MSAPKTRFSKQAVLDLLSERSQRLEDQFSFDREDGWNQVRDAEVPNIVAYGQYDALRQLRRDIIEGRIDA